jgi:hypothetical protein
MNKIKPGDFYQDCAYHPVLCTKSDYANDSIEGISLIDGSSPRLCSFINCKPRKISLRRAVQIKEKGPNKNQREHVEALNKQGWKFKIWW